MQGCGLRRIPLPRTPVHQGKKESQNLGFPPFQSTRRCARSARAALGRHPDGKKAEFLQPRRGSCGATREKKRTREA